MTYINQCNICRREGKKAVYIGKTCRSITERHEEHRADSKANKEDTHMYSHAKDHHKGVVDFTREPLKYHQSSMMR